MGSGKWFFLAGIGAGAYLTLRMSDKQIEGIKNFTARISNSKNLNEARRVAEDKFADTLRQQGSNLVDRIADSLKNQINSIDVKDWTSPEEPLDPDTKMSTTSTPNADDSKNKNGHVVIDGKIISS